ncbi:glycine cleavage system protein H [Halobacteriovorax marinus]|uniref:Glycine cleavage system H protein n=1 Tax=Halobacteriovorax marinus (strain ATCC BAA-682 / DSM 15412 / SJ) TaxID=862908 RepID=E1X118_HALMS|nr:glycine cleavage system protein GcvH [Halobacteriovorax marinus]ATH09350.1 glycine cleavage system protein H [Halobacteriovorax marinus]CBW28088.1 glycine cleavage system H protein [Halobacteriovorax marinus SJ]
MSHNVPKELKYTTDHEWAQLEGDIVTVGITDFAQSSLGDIVFVELPEVGDELSKEDSFGVVESIKSVSDLYSPLAGEVVEINSELVDSPESCNESPYGSWMIKLKVESADEFNSLMTPEAYSEHCESL